MFSKPKRLVGTSLMALTLVPVGVFAQANIFNKVFDAATKEMRQGQQPTASAAQSPNAPSNSGFASWRGDATPAFATKALLLAAVKHGDLAGIGDLSGSLDARNVMEDWKPIMASIAVILADEYQTPIPQDRNKGNCQSASTSGLLRAVHSITRRYTGTLSDRPPEFRKAGQQSNPAPITETIRLELENTRNYCSQTALGQRRPYPMVESLQRLLEEYASATNEYVEEKRTALIQDYQAKEVAKQEAAQRQEVERRAADQRRIDAERQRIEDQQKKQKQVETNRVSG